MSWTASSRTFVSALLLTLAACQSPDGAARRIHTDNFRSTSNWIIEAEQLSRVSVRNGALDIESSAGLTLWFKPRLVGPVEIEFDATAVSEGGPHDEVSDLNVFWMATNRDGSAPFPSSRDGRFSAYDDLLTYYVGLGGNRNTTTRFRRYIGDAGNRPLLPEHDLKTPDVLLVPNKKQTITLIADRNRIEYKRDGQTLFRLDDPSPYTSGWFALRTTKSHLRIERFRVRAL